MKGLFHKTKPVAAAQEMDAVISFISDRLCADLRSNESWREAAGCV
jgi:hypothetical protein